MDCLTLRKRDSPENNLIRYTYVVYLSMHYLLVSMPSIAACGVFVLRLWHLHGVNRSYAICS